MSGQQSNSTQNNHTSRPFSYQIPPDELTNQQAQQAQNNNSTARNARPFSYQLPPDENATLSRPPDVSPSAQPQPRQRLSITTNNGNGEQPRQWAGFPEQRFSTVETPIEDGTGIFEEEPAQIQPQPIQEGSQGNNQTDTHAQAAAVAASQFPEDKKDVTRVPSAYQSPPPTQEHPALSAPYAQNDPSHPQYQQQQQQPVPLSPDLIKRPTIPTPNHSNTQPSRDQAIALQSDPNDIPTFAPPPTAGKNKKASASAGPSSSSTSSWEHSLLGCADISTCCLGLFCPCIVYSRATYRLSKRSHKDARPGDGTNLLGWSACDGPCLGFALLCGCQGILAAILRTRVRRTYGIQGGDLVSDVCAGCCCCCCTVIQAENEVRSREEKGGYTRLEGMRYGVEAQQQQGAATTGGGVAAAV